MTETVYRMIELLGSVVAGVAVGTNLGLLHLMWMLLSGRLLASRGAVIPGLAAMGLEADAVRRSWAALTYGRWETEGVVRAWERQVQQKGLWQAHRHGTYRPVAVDLVGFFRPRLKDCASKHYSPAAGKALPAISVGLAVSVGQVGSMRVPVPRALVRLDAEQPSDSHLQAKLLHTVHGLLADDEAVVADRGFKVKHMQAAQIHRYVVRGPRNFTARRAYLPTYKGKGRKPTKGEWVRPLPRWRKGKLIPATPPDRVEQWTEGRLELRAEFWERLVSSDDSPQAPAFTCIVIHDPRYEHPLLVLTPLPVTGVHLRAFYCDRWPVEVIPLAAKQLLGASRQFVFAQDARYRLPELSLLAGAVLIYAAAAFPTVPTGFWDRHPQPSAGRLRRVLARTIFSSTWPVPPQLRRKQSRTDHLPKGIAAHRRHNSSTNPSSALSAPA